jgi:nickel-type superoxide dismutase maturation protease
VPRLARRTWVRTGELLAATAALAAWGLERVEVVGSSMAPTFISGDRLLVVRRCRRLRVGDLVALSDPTSPGRRLVKRVASIDEGSATVVGDNEAASTDSRHFGAVPVSAIRHLVVRRYAQGEGT